MEIRELRIGNTVYQNGDLSRIVQLEIRYKTKYRINDIEIDLSDIGKIFSGAPITEEWLIKLGFDADTLTIIPENNFSSISIEKNKDGFYITNLPVMLKYIHQLQNLYFALTGEELTINED